ncbi:ECF-type sigma factor [soil metagenome]
MNRERPSHTLSATALVHEAYLKLTAPREHPFANPAHFYAAAAQAMRRILVDHARAHAVRQAPAAQRAESTSDALPDVAALAAAAPEKILAVDIALTRLESEDPDSAAVVRLRFFAGLSVDQAAETLAISPRTAARLWTFARARLHQLLSTSESA